MSTTYSINEFNEVVPTTHGRRCNDTRAWRDATELELEQREELLALSAKNEILEDALKSILRHYVGLVKSGDAGNWDPEEEDVVMEARKALE